jgi:NADH:ubiquinone reductase (H+-translocating)
VTGVKVDKVDGNGVVADGPRIPSATVLWTAGVAPSPIVKLLGAETDRAGRVSVGPFMNVQHVPGVFVVGDAASVVRDGRPAPGVAQAAIQEGRFRSFDKGAMAVVGKNFAILESGRLHMSGFVTWLVWVFVHLILLPKLENRLRVRTQWFWSYYTGQRSSRLIPELPSAELVNLAIERTIAP